MYGVSNIGRKATANGINRHFLNSSKDETDDDGKQLRITRPRNMSVTKKDVNENQGGMTSKHVQTLQSKIRELHQSLAAKDSLPRSQIKATPNVLEGPRIQRVV